MDEYEEWRNFSFRLRNGVSERVLGSRLRPRKASGKAPVFTTSDPGGRLFTWVETIDCPELPRDFAERINAEAPEYITRYITGYLEAGLGGQLFIRPLAKHRATEEGILGRLGDHREGLTADAVTSTPGSFEALKIGGLKARNVEFRGSVALEYEVNDYCLCASIGRFSDEQLQGLRSNGNDDIVAFITYDAKKLISAIDDLAQAGLANGVRQVIAKAVTYDVRDTHLEVPPEYDHEDKRKPFETWLATAFVKPPGFVHENEFRILLTDPRAPGALPEETEPLFLESPGIRDSIVESGEL